MLKKTDRGWESGAFPIYNGKISIEYDCGLITCEPLLLVGNTGQIYHGIDLRKFKSVVGHNVLNVDVDPRKTSAKIIFPQQMQNFKINY